MKVIYILWLRQIKRYRRSKARMIGSLGQPLLFLLALGFGFGPIYQKAGEGNYLGPAIWFFKRNFSRSGLSFSNYTWPNLGRSNSSNHSGGRRFFPDDGCRLSANQFNAFAFSFCFYGFNRFSFHRPGHGNRRYSAGYAGLSDYYEFFNHADIFSFRRPVSPGKFSRPDCCGHQD